MRINDLKTLLFILLLAIFPISCGLGSGNEDGDENDSISEEGDNGKSAVDATTICMWSSVGLKETPEQKGKYKKGRRIFTSDSVDDR